MKRPRVRSNKKIEAVGQTRGNRRPERGSIAVSHQTATTLARRKGWMAENQKNLFIDDDAGLRDEARLLFPNYRVRVCDSVGAALEVSSE
jgi:hypothetical protein